MMGDDDERCRHADADAQPHNVGEMIRNGGMPMMNRPELKFSKMSSRNPSLSYDRRRREESWSSSEEREVGEEAALA